MTCKELRVRQIRLHVLVLFPILLILPTDITVPTVSHFFTSLLMPRTITTFGFRFFPEILNSWRIDKKCLTYFGAKYRGQMEEGKPRSTPPNQQYQYFDISGIVARTLLYGEGNQGTPCPLPRDTPRATVVTWSPVLQHDETCAMLLHSHSVTDNAPLSHTPRLAPPLKGSP